MDTALLVVLPVVGGYIFASRWTVTKFVVDREDGHRLYFRAAFYGVFLFTVALLIRIILISYVDGYDAFEKSIAQLYRGTLKEPDNHHQLDALTTSLFALTLGASFWVPFRWLPQRWLRYLYERAIRHDEIESLIAEAARRVVPVSITMENNKVYVGLVVETPDPRQHRKFLTVLPLMSGFRDSAAGRITFTTYYNRIYRKLPTLSTEIRVRDFRVALPMDKLQSLNMFDVVVYEEFQRQSEKTPRSTRKGKQKHDGGIVQPIRPKAASH